MCVKKWRRLVVRWDMCWALKSQRWIGKDLLGKARSQTCCWQCPQDNWNENQTYELFFKFTNSLVCLKMWLKGRWVWYNKRSKLKHSYNHLMMYNQALKCLFQMLDCLKWSRNAFIKTMICKRQISLYSRAVFCLYTNIKAFIFMQICCKFVSFVATI